MINAWVLYHDGIRNKFENLTGYGGFAETDPLSWGLHGSCKIILVLQAAEFLSAWVEGTRKTT